MTFKEALHIISGVFDLMYEEHTECIDEASAAEATFYKLVSELEDRNIKSLEDL